MSLVPCWILGAQCRDRSAAQEAEAVAQGQKPADYALQLSEQEKVRFRRMAQRAMEREGDLMRGAGIVPGARVVDMGCGPGAMLVELARIVGDGGEAVGVEPDPTARAAVSPIGLKRPTMIR